MVLDLITIFTENFEQMRNFYSNIIDLVEVNGLDDYVEYKSGGTRFAICTIETMVQFTDEYKQYRKGNNFELAFKCESRDSLDRDLKFILDNGGELITMPQVMPWGHYTALFSDPDGNIHELFTS